MVQQMQHLTSRRVLPRTARAPTAEGIRRCGARPRFRSYMRPDEANQAGLADQICQCSGEDPAGRMEEEAAGRISSNAFDVGALKRMAVLWCRCRPILDVRGVMSCGGRRTRRGWQPNDPVVAALSGPDLFRRPLGPVRLPARALIPIDYRRLRGAIAQLVAHLHGMEGVCGSSPHSSTSLNVTVRSAGGDGRAPSRRPAGNISGGSAPTRSVRDQYAISRGSIVVPPVTSRGVIRKPCQWVGIGSSSSSRATWWKSTPTQRTGSVMVSRLTYLSTVSAQGGPRCLLPAVRISGTG